MDDLDFAALLCSRLCHDLVSPVGAIGNGIEVLEDDDDPEIQRQALELLAQSAGQAASRLKYYRLAFGASTSSGGTIDISEAVDAARGYFSGGRVKLDWGQAALPMDVVLDKPTVKLLLNMILTAAEALPRGGDVVVAGEYGGADVTLRVTATGDNARLSDPVAEALEPGARAGALTAKAAPAYIVSRLAQTIGANLAVEQSDNAMCLCASALPVQQS